MTGNDTGEHPLVHWLKELQLISYAGATALLGALLYALIALAYERFYRSFGLAPDDVGITYATLVPRTAVALAIFVAIALGLFCLLTLASLAIAAPSVDEGPGVAKPADRTTVLLFSLAATAPAAIILIAVGIAPVLFDNPVLLGSLVVITSGGALLAVFIRRRLSGDRRSGALLTLCIGALSAIFVIGIGFSNSRADQLSAVVHEGDPIPPSGLTFVFDFHADPVCVETSDSNSGTFPGSPVYRLYLGEANGWLVLYDPMKDETNRVSSDGVLLTFLPISEADGSHATC